MGTTYIGPITTTILTLNALSKFDVKRYNSTQEVEDAHRELQRRIIDFNECFEKVNALTVENKIELGLRLIHKHIFLKEGEKMIEKYCEFNNKPAFITSACLENKNTTAYPASWFIGSDNDYFVFEYSEDPYVKKTIEKLLEKDSFVLEKISQLIKQYNLESLIAPCIHAREALVHFDKNEDLIEMTYSNPPANIVQSKSSKDINTGNSFITTSWGAPITQACFTEVRCESEGGGHFKWNYHVKK